MKGFNIAQVGSFDVENYGDLLFPVVLRHELNKRLHINDIFLFSPNGGKMPFFGDTVYPSSTLDAFCGSHNIDAIIIGGGDTVRIDNKVVLDYPESFIPSFSMWQYPIVIANKYGIPSIFNCPGVPLPFDSYQKIVADSLSMSSYVSVRDKNAKNTLVDTTNSKVDVVLDSVSLIADIYPKQSLDELFLELKRLNHIEDKYIVLQSNKSHLSDSGYIAALVELVNIINNKYDLQVVLSPIGYVHDDLGLLRTIYDQVDKRNVIAEKKMTPQQMLALFSHSQGFIGTSLHGLITSNAYHVPILAIDSSNFNKISGFLDLCGFSHRIVKNLPDLPRIFEEVFFDKISYTKYNSELKKLSLHFDKIADIIKKRVIPEEKDPLCSLIDDFYKVSQSSSFDVSANFLYDNRSLVRRVAKHDGLYHLSNYDNAKTILVSFVGKPIVTIKSIDIKTDGKTHTSFNVHNKTSLNGDSIFVNPVIEILDVGEANSIDLSLDYEEYDLHKIVNALNAYNSLANISMHQRLFNKVRSLKKVTSRSR